MSWTEDDRTDNVALAVADLPATPAQWVEIHRLSNRTDWKKALTRGDAAELIRILVGQMEGQASIEQAMEADLNEADMLSRIPQIEADDDFDFFGEVA